MRRFRSGEAGALHAVFRRAVHEGAAGHYSERQRAAWAPADTPPEGWEDWLAGMATFVGEADGRVTGFMALDREGHLEMAFVLPECMGRGVADALLAAVLAEARQRGHRRLTTEASHLARRFFLRQGWTEEARQEVERNGERLTNFRMYRDL